MTAAAAEVSLEAIRLLEELNVPVWMARCLMPGGRERYAIATSEAAAQEWIRTVQKSAWWRL